MIKKLLRIVNVSQGETVGYLVCPLRVDAIDVFAKIPHDIDLLIKSEGDVEIADSLDNAVDAVMRRWGNDAEKYDTSVEEKAPVKDPAALKAAVVERTMDSWRLGRSLPIHVSTACTALDAALRAASPPSAGEE